MERAESIVKMMKSVKVIEDGEVQQLNFFISVDWEKQFIVFCHLTERDE